MIHMAREWSWEKSLKSWLFKEQTQIQIDKDKPARILGEAELTYR